MPASERQIEANRRNATGPHKMTEAGKQSLRTNALRHGLATKLHVVLAGEDEGFYNEILDGLREEYAPRTTQEEMLVNQIAENYWRLIRARNMESGSFKLGIKIEAEEYGFNRVEPDDLLRGANLATALSHHHEIFSRIARYETTAERAYYRAIRELQKLQALPSRLQRHEPAKPEPEIRSVPQNEHQAPEPEPNPAEVIRSVPQKHVQSTDEEIDAAIARIDAEMLPKMKEMVRREINRGGKISF
jgi:hypothetical protein